MIKAKKCMRRFKSSFILIIIAIIGLIGCAKPTEESYQADSCPLPPSDNRGDSVFFSMNIVPKGMISQLPDCFGQIAELDSPDLPGLLTCSRYIEVFENYYGDVSIIERTKDEYLNWCNGVEQTTGVSETDVINRRPGWLVLSTSTWDADEWYVNVAHVCRWLVKSEVNDFDENLFFSWLSGMLVDDSFGAYYGYCDQSGYHTEHLTWEGVPEEANSPWDYSGKMEYLMESDSDGKTIHLGQKHDKTVGRWEETIVFTCQIRKKMVVNPILGEIWGDDLISNPLLSYGIKYEMSPHKSLANYFYTIARAENKIASAFCYWKDYQHDNEAVMYTGKSVPYLILEEANEDKYHEEFVFHVIYKSLGREPTIAELDLWMRRLKHHNSEEVAGGDMLLLECFASDEFASRKLRPIQVINAIRSAANLDDYGSYTQQQWIQRLEEGLTAREAAMELIHTDGFLRYCEKCHVFLSWQ